MTKDLLKRILTLTITKSDVMVVVVNLRDSGVSLAATHSQEELASLELQDVVPRRRHRPKGGGNRPGITGTSALTFCEVKKGRKNRDRKRRRRGGEAPEAEEKSWLEPYKESSE